MKKMQVTSPNLTVTAVRSLKKRSGTIHFASTPMKFSPIIPKAHLVRPLIVEEKEVDKEQEQEGKDSIDTVESEESLEELTLEKSVSFGMVETIKSYERTAKDIQERANELAGHKSPSDKNKKNESKNSGVDRNLISSAVVGRYCIHEGSDEDS